MPKTPTTATPKQKDTTPSILSGYTDAEIKAAGLDDFRVFLRQVWDYLILPPPTPLQNDMALSLSSGDKRMVLEAFRGAAKSWITAAFVLWRLFLDPRTKIMVVSASEAHAINFTTFVKRLIEGMPLLQHLAARGDQRNSNLAFDVGPAPPDISPSVKSVGITGQLTGSRADLIVADDIETPKNSYTHAMRERIAELVKEFDAVLKPDGRVIFLGTPQVEQSVYERLPDRGYVIRIWPAEIPETTEQYRGRLAPLIQRRIERGQKPGTPVEPTRFPRTDLDERAASYGRSGYALQFMLDTNPSDVDKHPLKLKDLIIHECDDEMTHVRMVHGSTPESVLNDLTAGGFDGDHYRRPVWLSEEMAKYTETVMFIDPSGRGTDETAYAIMRILYSQLYLIEVSGFRDGFAEPTLRALAAAALRHKVNTILVEPNYGGGMFTSLLRPCMTEMGCKVRIEDAEWARGQKELRILDTLEPLIQSHRLTVDRRVIEKDIKVQADTPDYSLVYQMTRMARIKGALGHDDRIEAVAGAASHFAERLKRSQTEAHDAHKASLLDAELREWGEHVFGVTVDRGKPLMWA